MKSCETIQHSVDDLKIKKYKFWVINCSIKVIELIAQP